MVRSGHPPVHIYDLFLGHVEALGDFRDEFRREIAIVDRLQLTLQPAQVEEQLLLGGGRTHFHERPRVQDVFLDRGADPPHRVSSEPEPAIRIEALHRLHDPDISLGNQIGQRQAIAAIAHGNLGDEA